MIDAIPTFFEKPNHIGLPRFPTDILSQQIAESGYSISFSYYKRFRFYNIYIRNGLEWCWFMDHNQLINLIQNFFKRLEEENVHIESLVVSDSNGLFFSHHFIDKGPRNIYSHSKSFVSLLFGIALEEGLLSLEDHVVDYFKDELSNEQYQKYYPMLLKHPLTMRSGFDESLLMMNDRLELSSYFDYLFSHDLKRNPEERFVYSNGDTYIICRVLEKVYKRKVLDVVYEKILSKLGIEYPVWEEDKQGHTFGASGLELTIEDMNKLGILVLNKGTYKGQKIISEEYIDLLYKTDVPTDGWGWGNYSLQFWHTPQGNGIRADGAFGQYTFIYPKLDIALSIQRSEDDEQPKVVDLIINEILLKL